MIFREVNKRVSQNFLVDLFYQQKQFYFKGLLSLQEVFFTEELEIHMTVTESWDCSAKGQEECYSCV